ncbi:dNA-damage-inducible protein D [Coprobacillus sp. CAG:605]|nr:dNA-damage-inducible protein D [Coprobacillus sp. CAG:605]
MNEISKYNEIIFEDIKHIDEYGNEYWYARELSKVLEYKDWRNFLKVLNKAKEACENSGIVVNDNFVQVDKTIEIGNKVKRNIIDYELSRYACYLIIQNADSNKERVSLCKTYFAIQTRKRELYSLNQTAKNCGVKNFDKFHNAGYKGLYNGETVNDIAKRKKLRYREDILDNMGSEELAANLFRITQIESKLKKDNIYGEEEANQTHYNIGKNIREVIAKNGGIMPEKLPTPEI